MTGMWLTYASSTIVAMVEDTSRVENSWLMCSSHRAIISAWSMAGGSSGKMLVDGLGLAKYHPAIESGEWLRRVRRKMTAGGFVKNFPRFSARDSDRESG